MPQSIPYRILYIDDESAFLNSFSRSLADEFDIKTIQPSNELTSEILSSRLVELDFDYLIVDYHLNVTANCGYDGDDVLRDFLDKNPYFPVMLFTSFDANAIASVKDLDVDMIHNKKEYTLEEFRTAFILKVKAKIDAYKNRLNEAETALQSLVAKKMAGSELNAKEEETAIELDEFLDDVLGGKRGFSFPDELKKMSNDSRIVQLLSKTDDLIMRLSKYEAVQE